jgi:hypothetical protein
LVSVFGLVAVVGLVAAGSATAVEIKLSKPYKGKTEFDTANVYFVNLTEAFDEIKEEPARTQLAEEIVRRGERLPPIFYPVEPKGALAGLVASIADKAPERVVTAARGVFTQYKADGAGAFREILKSVEIALDDGRKDDALYLIQAVDMDARYELTPRFKAEYFRAASLHSKSRALAGGLAKEADWWGKIADQYYKAIGWLGRTAEKDVSEVTGRVRIHLEIIGREKQKAADLVQGILAAHKPEAIPQKVDELISRLKGEGEHDLAVRVKTEAKTAQEKMELARIAEAERSSRTGQMAGLTQGSMPPSVRMREDGDRGSSADDALRACGNIAAVCVVCCCICCGDICDRNARASSPEEQRRWEENQQAFTQMAWFFTLPFWGPVWLISQLDECNKNMEQGRRLAIAERESRVCGCCPKSSSSKQKTRIAAEPQVKGNHKPCGCCGKSRKSERSPERVEMADQRDDYSPVAKTKARSGGCCKQKKH